MVEFENLRQNGSDLSKQAALVLPHLETTQEFWQGVYLGQFFTFSFRFYDKEFRRIYKFITVLQVEGLTHVSVNHGDTDLNTE